MTDYFELASEAYFKWWNDNWDESPDWCRAKNDPMLPGRSVSSCEVTDTGRHIIRLAYSGGQMGLAVEVEPGQYTFIPRDAEAD